MKIDTARAIGWLADIPTTCPSDFLLTTLRTDRQDAKHVNSGFGATSIDLGSPGQNIYTTQLNDGYGDFTGTSAAAPHLTGAIALLRPLTDAGLMIDAAHQGRGSPVAPGGPFSQRVPTRTG